MTEFVWLVGGVLLGMGSCVAYLKRKGLLASSRIIKYTGERLDTHRYPK